MTKMMSLPLLLSSLLASTAMAAPSTSYKPRPYTVNVDPKFIENTRQRAANFQPSFNIDAPAWFDGPPAANVSAVAKYWAEDFDFTRFQHEINSNFSNYMITVPPPGGNYNRSLDIHFFHQVSKRKDAIPMIMFHGWPSTNLEWAKVIPDLVNPPNSSLPAFHIVAPDLPGFGFSPSATTPGLGADEMAAAFASMMQQLGYKRYVVYSTDLGYQVGRSMVRKYVDRLINHVTDFYIVFPNATDFQRYANNQTTPEETAYISSINSYENDHSAYASVHSTYPLSIAYALYDSPVGFLAWMWQLVYSVSDTLQTSEQLIRRALMLYIPGPYGNIRAYKETFSQFITGPDTKTSVPTSVTQWGGLSGYPALANFNFAPPEWIERTANLTYFKRHTSSGGHFPAESEPKQLIQDIWEMFADPKTRV